MRGVGTPTPRDGFPCRGTGMVGRWGGRVWGFVDAGMGGWVLCREDEGLLQGARLPGRLAWA